MNRGLAGSGVTTRFRVCVGITVQGWVGTPICRLLKSDGRDYSLENYNIITEYYWRAKWIKNRSVPVICAFIRTWRRSSGTRSNLQRLTFLRVIFTSILWRAFLRNYFICILLTFGLENCAVITGCDIVRLCGQILKLYIHVGVLNF